MKTIPNINRDQRIKEIMNTPNKKISYKLALLKFQKEIRALFLTSSFIKKNR